MSEPQQPPPPLGEPTDVAVDPDDVADEQEGTTPTSVTTRYDEGDAQGGTGGLDAGGAG